MQIYITQLDLVLGEPRAHSLRNLGNDLLRQRRPSPGLARVVEPCVVPASAVANLDGETTDRVMKTLGDANARGTAIIMATHDVSLVERFRRRTLEIDGGRVVGQR